jgi:hypothetical protein
MMCLLLMFSELRCERILSYICATKNAVLGMIHGDALDEGCFCARSFTVKK